MTLALKYSLLAVTTFGFAFGVAVIISRAVFSASAYVLLWSLLLIAPLLVGAVIFAYRRTPAPKAARAAIEARNRCGGLLLAAEEHDISGWQERLGKLQEPQLVWRSRRLTLAFLLAIAVVVLSLIIPQRHLGIVSARTLDVSEEVGALQERIDEMEKEEVVPPEEAKKLEEQLEEIQREAVGSDPFKTWEALDHMDESLDNKLKEEVEGAMADAQNLAGLEALASGLQESAGAMDPKQLAAAMSQLSGLMDQALEESEALRSALDAQTISQCESGTLNAESLSKLAAALQGSCSSLSGKLQRLADNKMIDPSALGQLAQLSQSDAESLAEFLKNNQGSMSMSEMMAEWLKHQEGKCSSQSG